MLSLQQQVLSYEMKYGETSDCIRCSSEEAGNSSTGRVPLKEALETEMRADGSGAADQGFATNCYTAR